MKCLSVRQPWAWAILHAGKDVENRTWPTKFRGRILIHAGLNRDRCVFGYDQSPSMTLVEEFLESDLQTELKFGELPTGAIIGSVEIFDCIPAAECSSKWAEVSPDRPSYCWLLEDARAFAEPIPYKGRLGLFDVPSPDEILEAL